MKPKKLSLALILPVVLIVACVTTPVTKRGALILIPFDQEVALGNQAYKEMISKEKESADPRLNEIVRRVARRIADVSDMPDLKWEFKLIESNVQNAFCAPGGKVVVYTGILPVAANEAGLAAVLGHEVAHAIARHGAQRLSQELLVQGALGVAAVSMTSKNRNVIIGALGLGATLGLTLPFSRMNESEADEIGVVYMARAGYDPNEAMRFWQRFSSQKGSGGKPPEFLSTHPSDETRIHEIQQLLPSALREYQIAKAKYGLGETF